MTRAEAARQYAQALGELVWAATKRVQYPASPSIRQEQEEAQQALAKAVEVLTGPFQPVQLCCGQQFTSPEAFRAHLRGYGD